MSSWLPNFNFIFILVSAWDSALPHGCLALALASNRPSSNTSLPLAVSITDSLLCSSLKTYVFHNKYAPPQSAYPTCQTDFTLSDNVSQIFLLNNFSCLTRIYLLFICLTSCVRLSCQSSVLIAHSICTCPIMSSLDVQLSK